MDQKIKTIMNIVVVIAVVLGSLGSIHIGR